ncbi:unnamed protein product, partial [Polarella glacialis]
MAMVTSWNIFAESPELLAAVAASAGLESAGRFVACARLLGASAREVLPSLGQRLRHFIVVGGEGSNGASRASCEFLSFSSSSSWRPLASSQARRAGCAAAVLDGSLYLVGGDGSDFQTLSTVERLESPQGGRGDLTSPGAVWKSLPPMSARRAECGAAAVAGALYVVGGRDVDGAPLASVERYRPSAGIWEAVPPMDTVRSGCATIACCGLLCVAGGFGPSEKALDEVCCFDPTLGMLWKALPWMRSPRARSAAVAIGSRFCITGGLTDFDSPLTSAEYLDLPTGAAWEELPSLRVSRWGHVAVQLAGSICVLGGFGCLVAQSGDAANENSE